MCVCVCVCVCETETETETETDRQVLSVCMCVCVRGDRSRLQRAEDARETRHLDQGPGELEMTKRHEGVCLRVCVRVCYRGRGRS